MNWTQQDQAVFERAIALHQQGSAARAQAIYREILSRFPHHADSLHLLGVARYQQGDGASALKLMREAVRLNPGYAEAYSNMSVVLYEMQCYEEALAQSDAAIRLNPGYAEAHYNRGNALKAICRFDEAVTSYEEAARLNPKDAAAYSNRGVALHGLAQPEAALESYRTAIRLRPDYAEAYSNQGVVLEDLLRYDEAMESYETAIRLNPGFAEAYLNRGNLLKAQQRYAAAMESYETSISLRPEHAESRVNKSMLQLLLGNFAEGLAGYEWRWRTRQLLSSVRQFVQPQWRGQFPLKGRTILLHAEQGLGDTLQFCRYAPMVARLGARVILEADPPLAGLLRQLPGIAEVVALGGCLPAFDCYCPLMSLPLAFGTTLESIPSPDAYLSAEPERVAGFARLLGPRTRPRVGLVWNGGSRPDQPELNAVNERRNIPLEVIARLDTEGIEFVSLQKGEPAESQFMYRRKALWPRDNMVVLTDRLHDFADTAALVANLDLVIAVDTSVAHLAAAMGRPVWLLSRFDGCWRWLVDRDDSPWYRSVRIYRQERPGEWDGTLCRVSGDLAAWRRFGAAT